MFIESRVRNTLRLRQFGHCYPDRLSEPEIPLQLPERRRQRGSIERINHASYRISHIIKEQ